MAKKPVKKDYTDKPVANDEIVVNKPVSDFDAIFILNECKEQLRALINACATNDQGAIENVAAEAQAFIETI